MTVSKLLSFLDVSVDAWSQLPKVAAIEFSNQRYIYTTDRPKLGSIIRWFKVLDLGDGDAVLLLQNRTMDNTICPGGITYDGRPGIHQIFYISEITGVTFK